jgi:hypothetical protein
MKDLYQLNKDGAQQPWVVLHLGRGRGAKQLPVVRGEPRHSGGTSASGDPYPGRPRGQTEGPMMRDIRAT